MDYFVIDGLVFIGLILIWIIANLLSLRISLFLAILGTVGFSVQFLYIIYWGGFNLIPIILALVCAALILSGDRNVAYKTGTFVLSRLTNQPIKYLEAGIRWIDPVWEKVAMSADGEEDTSADLQKLQIEIMKTPKMQTKTRGVQVIIMDIVFFLKLKEGGVDMLFDIEGGPDTVYNGVETFTIGFFRDKVAEVGAEKFDTDWKTATADMTKNLKIAINQYCIDNEFPYEIPITSTIVIGDTELDPEYYVALAKQVYAVLEQNAQDTIAKKLSARLLRAGKKILPGRTPAEQLEAAKIALSIVKKDIQQRGYSLDADIRILLTELAKIMKGTSTN